MIRIEKYLSVLAITLPVLFWCACTQERQPCLTPKTASLSIKSVWKNTDTTSIDTALNAAVFAPFGGPVTGGVLYGRSSNFTVSLSPQSDTCRWKFTPDTTGGGVFDTLTFLYSRELHFISNACGYSYVYNLNSVLATHHSIDSVFIKNASVTNNVNTANILLFIYPHS